ncbi:hypothetical protein MPLA_670007 [Mesorhizobium sp. ORS 3359]|nr:hypothetical protein MPLA_670007 [Mesorhizobium sp. ORS 3359]
MQSLTLALGWVFDRHARPRTRFVSLHLSKRVGLGLTRPGRVMSSSTGSWGTAHYPRGVLFGQVAGTLMKDEKWFTISDSASSRSSPPCATFFVSPCSRQSACAIHFCPSERNREWKAVPNDGASGVPLSRQMQLPLTLPPSILTLLHKNITKTRLHITQLFST